MCAPWGLLPHFPCLHILITATLQRHIQSSHLSGAPHPRLSHPPHCHPLYSSNSLWGPLEPTAALGRRSRHYLFSSVSLLLEGRNGPARFCIQGSEKFLVPSGDSPKRQNEAPGAQLGNHQLHWKCTLPPTRSFRPSAYSCQKLAPMLTADCSQPQRKKEIDKNVQH